MNLFFLSLDIILPNSIILFAIWKVENVTVKWYGINLLAACSLGGIAHNAAIDLEVKLKSSNEFLFSILYWFTLYLRAMTFGVIRLIILFCIIEIYSIYALKTKMLKTLYKRKSRVIILIYLLAQVVSITVASLKFNYNGAFLAIVATCYYSVNVMIYLSSITVMSAAIYTTYRNKLFHENQQLKKALKPLVLYFLPITLIDLCLIVSAIGLTINTDWLDVLSDTINTFIKFRATIVALCTVFVLPSFRKAMFNLLGIKRQRRITAVIPFTETHPNGDRNNI